MEFYIPDGITFTECRERIPHPKIWLSLLFCNFNLSCDRGEPKLLIQFLDLSGCRI